MKARARASSFGSPSISSGVIAKAGIVPNVNTVMVNGVIIIAAKKTLKTSRKPERLCWHNWWIDFDQSYYAVE